MRNGQLSLSNGNISFGWGVKLDFRISSEDLVHFDFMLDMNGYYLYLKVKKDELYVNQKQCALWAKRYCVAPFDLEKNVYFIGVEKVDYKPKEEPINENSPINFLSKEEQKYLRKNRKANLIYEYYSFARYILPDVDHKYIKTSFFVILSVLLADKVKYRFRFGYIYPNLYCMALGDSNTHKTSTRKVITFILGQIRPEVFGNGLVSSEGIQEMLKRADGKSTFAFIDEFQKYFTENSAKRYKAGFSTKLNEAYDEELYLNATKLEMKTETNNTKIITSRFSLYVTGIGSKLADSIDESVLGTGFIERFLIVYLDDEVKKEVVRNDYYLDDKATTLTQNEYDINKKTLIELISNRYFVVNNLNEEIKMTNEATSKMNDWKYDLDLFANENNKESSIGKFIISITKCCILLGRYKNELKISLTTVLEVLEVAQFWFDSMLAFYKRLQKTGFQIKADKIYNYIKSHRQVNLKKINREFSYFVERGIDPIPTIIRNLESQGKIKQFPKYKNGIKADDYVEAIFFEDDK